MKKFILIICLSLMGFSIASQISFNSGMLSEILKFRIDFDKRSMALEDSENMLVQPEGPIFRRTGTEFIDEAITEISYTTTEANEPNEPVYGDYTEYFVGIYPNNTQNIVCNGKEDSTVDTSWGTNGYWPSGLVNAVCYTMLQTSDERILVSHNYYTLSMIDINGVTDTTWATNGQYITDTSETRRILEDNDGNFHVFGSAPSLGTEYVYQKISSEGVFIAGITWNDSGMTGFNDACWTDENKTRIIAVGNYSAFNADRCNVMAIDAATGTIDTTWTGNISNSGFARMLTAEMTQNVYKIIKQGDNFVLYFNNTDHMLAKMLADGSDLDTTWGTNGIIDVNYSSFPNQEACNLIIDSNDDIYFIMNYSSTTTFYRIDSTGNIIDTHDEAGGVNVYNSLLDFNNKLVIGKGSYCQIWTKDFVFESEFEVADTTYILWIIPDISTREITGYTGGGTGETTTTIITTRDKTRLIPFQFSVSDAYVLEFGHNFVGFLR